MKEWRLTREIEVLEQKPTFNIFVATAIDIQLFKQLSVKKHVKHVYEASHNGR
jgi:hypothetical protein